MISQYHNNTHKQHVHVVSTFALVEIICVRSIIIVIIMIITCAAVTLTFLGAASS